ncbi:MAG TPA: sugar ABC transporter permease [candidate division Zixibacteria bacterium]|nr:sugar ABC transporter permease [candidate division Zixibacteria bacterium]
MNRIFSKDILRSYFFLLPFAVFIIAFILIPVVGAVINSLYKDVTFREREFLLFDNYISLFKDSGFWQSLRFSMLFILVSVPFELILGLIFALLLNQIRRFRGLIWAAVLIPWAIPSAISARTWELIYNYNYGLANYLLSGIGITGEPINWLGTNVGAFISVVIADAWKTAPFITIILLAGLQGIPENLHRQSRVDGANFLQGFQKITLPLLKPVIVVALLFRTIDALRVFDVIYVLTGGGPGGATTSLSIFGYNYYINGDFGYGSTISVVLFAVAFGLSILYVKLSRFEAGLR